MATTVQEIMNQAIQHQNAGRFQQAAALYQQILSQNPNQPEALNSLGILASQAGRHDVAVDLISRAVSLNPKEARFHLNRGMALDECGRTDEAIACYHNALTIKPDYARGYSNLGNALLAKGRISEALAACRKSVELAPDYADARNNLGNCLHRIGAIDEAIAQFQKAIALRPNLPEVYSNLGGALVAKGLVDEAIVACRKSIALQADFAVGHWSLGMMLLTKGEFEEGWKEYDWRSRVRELGPTLKLPQPLWDGSPLNGKRILVYAEQGFGDTIQFVRYVPDIVKLGGKLVLACQQELCRLMGYQDNITELVSFNAALPAFDVQCPILTLPRLFGTNLNNIPAAAPYLKIDAALKEKWKERLPQDSSLVKIGVAWAGRPAHRNDHNRSFPLSMLAGLAKIPRIWLCSLQKGEAAKQATNPPDGMEIRDFGDQIEDFADTAALIENLDLVVSADTAVVHLAGALNKQVWVLIPFAPDWRWMLKRADTPWYLTMRLFRQERLGDWEAPIARLTDALRSL